MSLRENRVIYVGFGAHEGGPWPLGGFVSGTRMLLESQLFDHTSFALSAYTIPGEGSYARRFFEDVRRFRESLRSHPDFPVVMMQVGYYKSTYREYALGLLARRSGRRLLLDIRAGSVLDFLDRDSNAVERHLFRRLMGLSDLALAQCRAFVPELHQRYPGAQFRWVPNFVRAAQVTERRTPAYGDGQRLKLVYFGYYLPTKGIREMLEAVRRCRNERGLEVELHLAGASDDEQMNRSIRAAAADGVVNHGRLEQPELWELLEGMHVLLYPTSFFGEGHTNAINEALMKGLVVVATRHNQLPNILPEEETLWLDSERLVDSLVERIEFLVKTPDFVNRVGPANQRFLLDEYADTRWIPFLERNLDSLAGSRGGE